MQKKHKIILLLLATGFLLADAVFAAAGDERFTGGSYDGYAQDAVMDVPVTLPAGTVITVF